MTMTEQQPNKPALIADDGVIIHGVAVRSQGSHAFPDGCGVETPPFARIAALIFY